MKPPHSNRPRPGGPHKPHRQGGHGPRGPAEPTGERGPRGDRPPRPYGQGQGHGQATPRFAPGEAHRAPREGTERSFGPDRPRGAGAPHGTVWLYGLHAVAAALANPARRLRRLALTEEAEAALTARLPPPWPVPAERMDRARIDRLLGRDAVHQGVALLADPLAGPGLAQALERPGLAPRSPVLVLDQVTDPRNIGAILRCAAAFGAAAVIMQERNAPEETGALAKAASGALETVPLLRAVNIARTLAALKAAGLWVVGLDSGGGALSGPALAERRVALVLGAEGEGLRRLTRDTCDEIAGIAMPGGIESLNVSAAAAVALYELVRR